MRLRLTALACAALAFPPLATRALAADRDLAPVTATGVDEERPTEAARDPSGFATTVVNRRTEARRASDLLLEAPGTVIRDLGLNQSATVSVRGSSSDQVSVLFDGVPLNSVAGGGTDLSTLPAPLVKKIVVARGAVGSRYGAGALGGAVEIESVASTGETRPFGDLSYGSFGTVEGSVGVGALLGRVELMLAGFGRRSEGDFPYRYDEQPQVAGSPLYTRYRANNDARRAGGVAKLGGRLGAWRLDLLTEADGGERGLPGTIQSPSPDPRLRDARLVAAGKAARGLGAGELAFDLSARGGELGLAPNRASPFDRQRETALGATVTVRQLLGRHAVEAGLWGSREAIASPLHGDHGRLRGAVFASDELDLGLLSLLPAARVEAAGGLWGVSPKLGVAVPLREVLTLKGNVGRSFRAPSFGELYLEQGFVTGNPDLQPERAFYADGGATLKLGRSLTASAAGFYTFYEDLIQYELFPPFKAKPFNFGVADVYGAESELAARRGPFDASLAYTLTFSRNRYDTERFYLKELPYRPRHRLYARAGAELWRLAGHVAADVQSAQFLNRTNTDQIPARVRLDAGLSLLVWREWGVRVGGEAKNVLDADAMDLYGLPLPGRAFALTLRVDGPEPGSPDHG